MPSFLMRRFAEALVFVMTFACLGFNAGVERIAHAQAGLSYKKYVYGSTSRECGYPHLRFDMNKIFETAKKYPNPEIIIVTPEERRQIQQEINEWNTQGKQPRMGIDPCSICSRDYVACVVYKIYEGDVTKEDRCLKDEWRRWRDDWDRKIWKIFDQALFQFALLDNNYYQINFQLRIGPDGRVVSWASPGGIWGGNNTAKQTWKEMSNWTLEELKKIQAMPFPEGSALQYVDRNPTLYHNITDKAGREIMGNQSSPIPEEPCK